MAEIKWIKITTSIFDDEAIKVIEQMPEGDAILVIWFKLLVQAGIINDSGLVYFKKDIPFTEETLSIVFNRPINTIRLALSTFEKFGMIEIADNRTILIRNWEKHQNIETLDIIREQTRERVRKHREKQKLLLCNANCNDDVTLHVTQCNAVEEDIEEDIEREEEYKYSSSTKKIKLTEEEEEILKNFSKGAKRKIKSYTLWRDKVIESGKYIDILKEEKERLEKLERQKAKEVIPPPEKFEKSTPEEDTAGLELLRETVKKIRKRG